jgi:hypothetical protein
MNRQPAVNPDPMPVIVGAPRSGTTLLRFMLDAHPELAIPPETGFLAIGASIKGNHTDIRKEFFDAITRFPPDAPAWNDFGIPAARLWSLLCDITPFSVAEGYRTFYRAYASRFGKRRWGDKTPTYCLHLTTIEEILPEAHFIHVIRDGRDVALSLRRMWFSPSNEIDALGAYWMNCVMTARQQGARARHYLEVRFEELIQEPIAVLERICRFVDLAYSPQMLDYHLLTPDRLKEHLGRTRVDGTMVLSHDERVQQQALTMQPPQRSRVQSWKMGMSAEEQARFAAATGQFLVELGYTL